MRYVEVGTDTVLMDFRVDGASVFKLYTPAATASLPDASEGVGLIYDTTADKLKMSDGTSWETVTSS